MEDALQIIEARLARIEKYALINTKSALTIDEAAIITGISKGQIYRLTSERQIPHYKRGQKLYFNKVELEAWLLERKIETSASIESQAATYAATRR